MKVAFSTLGCRVNSYETEAMTEKFLMDGYDLVDFESFADVYVINTCTVTSSGDKKSRQMIGRAKRRNPSGIIAVVGCYSQMAWEQLKNIEGVNVILGTKNKGEIVHWVNRAMAEGKQIVRIKEVSQDKSFEELNIENFTHKNRAFIKIQDGCNKFCSYCLIPYARGAVCSKNPEKIIEETKILASKGFREIILSGIHTASYGKDFKLKYNLLDLLEVLDGIEGIDRIRLGSLDPEFFSTTTILRLKKLKKLCPHFHISLQSGCNSTLSRMNRHYTTEYFEEVVKELRNTIANISITTDIIVGFPGESDIDFDKTYVFLKKIGLSKMHIFKYSKREGTKAASLPDQIEPEKKESRSKILLDLNCELERKFIDKYLSTRMNVLFEQEIKDEPNIYIGYTPNYLKVAIETNINVINEIIPIELVRNTESYVLGKI